MVNKVRNCLVTIIRCITVTLTVSSWGQMAIQKMRLTEKYSHHILSRVRNVKTAGFPHWTKKSLKVRQELGTINVWWVTCFTWVTWVILGSCWTTFVFMCKLKSHCLSCCHMSRESRVMLMILNVLNKR